MYVGFIILSIIVALIRRGKFSNIKYFRFSLWYLLILALLIYAGYIVGTIMEIPFVLDYAYWIYFAVYLLIMITVVFNLNNIWSYILVVGIGLNFTATFLNGGKMPILQSALDMAGITDNAQLYLSYFGATNQLTITNPYVMGLCKILGVPLGITGLPISAGDIIIAISVFFIIQKMMVVPSARKATPQERLAYTDQLKYTSEYNLDEIAKAAKEESEEFETSIPAALKEPSTLADTQATDKKSAEKTFEESFLLDDNLQDKKKDDIELAFDTEFESGSEDLQDDDEFDSFLQKLDNINKQEERDEAVGFEDIKEENVKDIDDILGATKFSEPQEEMPKTEEITPENIEIESEEEKENIAKLLDDLDQTDTTKQAAAEQITKSDLESVSDDEIQNIVSELAEKDDTYTEEYVDEELEEQKSENADKMLNYMLSIFEKQKKAQSQVELNYEDDEEETIYKNALKKDDYGPYTSKPKIDLFDDIRNEYDKNQQNEYYSDEDVNTTNPFVIENGRIVENPNYKFRKSADADYKRKEQEVKDEAVIAFDSTQNLEFIRKEIFAELKKQEEEAKNTTIQTSQSNNNMNTTQIIPHLNTVDESNQAYNSDVSAKKGGTKEEYERVEFEIDGKTMYVWIKK